VRIRDAHKVLLILDEVQSARAHGSGLPSSTRASARTGWSWQGAGRRRAAGLRLRRQTQAHGRIHPGLTRLTFGGNPLAAAAVGLEALHVLRDEGLRRRAACSCPHAAALHAIDSPALSGARARTVDGPRSIPPSRAREACERLLAKGVLSKETHHTVVRLAPPLVIAPEEPDRALDRSSPRCCMSSMARGGGHARLNWTGLKGPLA
jgi:ornithine--oxo-acid transaminase